MSSDKVKCKFCDHTIKKNGDTEAAIALLEQHVETEHAEEAERIAMFKTYKW